MEWFNTLGGGASIVGFFFAFFWFLNDRKAKQYSTEAQHRLEKSIEEGNKRLESNQKDTRLSIEEGNKRLELSLADTQLSIEEGNKRVENIIVTMQARWDQTDDYHKQYLTRILDKVS